MKVPDPSVVPDAQPAASSPAPVVASPQSVDLDSLSETELHEWRMDGTLPSSSKVATPPADSSPAVAVEDQPASTDASPVAASEPAKTPLGKGEEARIPQLLKDRAQERERAERAERRAAELEARLRPAPDARPAAPSPAPAGLVKPDPEAFPYGTSDPGYLEALTDYKVAVHGATQRAQWEETQRQATARQEFERVMSAFNEKAAVARSKHPDFDAVALESPTLIREGSLADLWIREDDAGAEILYHVQKPENAAELRRILALPYNKQIKEWIHLGDRLTGDTPSAPSTNAPPPPPALKTRATPADPVERALAEGTSDEATGAYNEAMNRRELARLKR